MAHPERTVRGKRPDPALQSLNAIRLSDHGYVSGGRVGQMQADLARQITRGSAVGAATSPEERIIRVLSVTGGYLTLLAGYSVISLMILR